ncbi:ATP-binding protein [Clostridiaceae bacterium HSG29]|nr:ATP-binding protein [Clostridiaceae bacterium HSG29]
MKINRATNIRTRFIIILSIVITLIMIIIGVSIIYIQNKQRTKTLYNRSDSIIKQLSLVLQTPLWESDKDDLDTIINSYLKDKIVLSIKVKENDEIISFVSENNESKDINKKYQFTKSGIVISKIGDKIGDFEVCFSRIVIAKEIYNIVNLIIIFEGILIVIIVFIVTLITGKYISKPLNLLVKIAKEVDANNLNVKLPDMQNNYEINALINAYDIMLKNMNESIDKLKESEEYNRTIIEILPDTIIKTNIEGKYLDIIGLNKKNSFYTKEETIGKYISDFLSEVEANKILDSIKKCIEEKNIQTVEYMFSTPEGKLCFEARIIETGNNEALVLVRDITIQKKAEIDLKESEERFSLFMGYLPALAFIKTSNSEIIYTNEYMNKNFETKNWKGKTAKDFYSEEVGNKIIALDKLALEEGNQLSVEHLYHKDGSEHIYETKRFVLHRDGKKSLLAGIGLDVTKQKKAEKELKLYQSNLEKTILKRTEELDKSNKELERFAYIASHDLQEPLRMVTSYLQLLVKRYSDKFDQDGTDFIEYAVDGAKRMQILIDDLLKYSRIGTKVKKFELIDLEKVLENTLKNIEVIIEENDATIVHSSLPIIFGDEVQISRLFQNLIGNAIKFKGDRQPEIRITSEENEEFWKFKIEDNGIGIKEEYFDKIFQVFQRLHSRGEYPGTGIGLAICEKIVDSHNGIINVDSEYGRGTTFNFTIAKRGIDDE